MYIWLMLSRTFPNGFLQRGEGEYKQTHVMILMIEKRIARASTYKFRCQPPIIKCWQPANQRTNRHFRKHYLRHRIQIKSYHTRVPPPAPLLHTHTRTHTYELYASIYSTFPHNPVGIPQIHGTINDNGESIETQ